MMDRNVIALHAIGVIALLLIIGSSMAIGATVTDPDVPWGRLSVLVLSLAQLAAYVIVAWL